MYSKPFSTMHIPIITGTMNGSKEVKSPNKSSITPNTRIISDESFVIFELKKNPTIP